jgi:hypothetical protein
MAACDICGQRWVRPVTIQPKPSYEDYKKVDTYPAFPETFNAPSAGWAQDFQNHYDRILKQAVDAMGLTTPDTAKHAKTWGLDGPVGPPAPDKSRISAFDLFSDELWSEALKRGEHREIKPHIVFKTLSIMWADPAYADVRKKWEAVVERMRARR